MAAVAALLASCSGGVVRRNFEGMGEAGPPPPDFGGVRKRVALLAFLNESPQRGGDLGEVATAELRMELARTGRFLVGRAGGRLFGSSKEVYSGGGVKLAQLSRRAKAAGIGFVVFGRILDARVRERGDEVGLIRKTRSYTESRVEVRVFDVNGGKEAHTAVVRGHADDSAYRFFAGSAEDRARHRRNLLRYGVRVAARKAVPGILDASAKLDWVGRVAKVVGDKIYINAGRESGINVSDVLRAMTEGSEIYDPDTGALIGVSEGEVKGTLEVVDYFGPDGSIATLHSGGAVHEGDYVRLY